MGGELERRMAEAAVEVVHPATGELLTHGSPDEDLASALEVIREAEHDLADAKRVISGWLLERMDHEASWTRRGGAFKLQSVAPHPVTEYDGEALRRLLDEAVEAGAISEAARDGAVSVELSYKVHAAGVGALLRLGGELAEQVRACGQDVERRRYVRVTRVS